MQSEDTIARLDRRLTSTTISANSTMDQRVRDLLAQERIAVTGVSVPIPREDAVARICVTSIVRMISSDP